METLVDNVIASDFKSAWKRALYDIHEKNGILKAEDVVEAARLENSPLHEKFEWNNKKAGDLYRLHQARNLILQFKFIAKEETGKEVRIFVSLKDDRANEGGGYRTMVSVMSDDDLRKKLLHEVKQELFALREKYKNLVELAEVFAAIDKL